MQRQLKLTLMMLPVLHLMLDLPIEKKFEALSSNDSTRQGALQGQSQRGIYFASCNDFGMNTSKQPKLDLQYQEQPNFP
jgi:hypothetical protein